MDECPNDSTDAAISDSEEPAPDLEASHSKDSGTSSGAKFNFESRDFPELTPDDFPLDRYQPVSIIGRGTVGTVYLCRDRRLAGKKVAVKLMRAFLEKDMMAFQQEAKATSRLSHRSIIAVYDFGATASGAAYMAMEYVEGVSIDKLIRSQGPLSVDRALKIAVNLADALAYAHSCGIFHRDIKTSNILLVMGDSREPDVRLIDFGVAAIQHNIDEAIRVQGRTIVGTPQYMSPDQCFNLPYDERSEVYSLGCVLFEMLTGKPPFQGETALEVIAKHANETPPTLAYAHGFQNFTNRIESVVGRCLAKDREQRYQSMHQLKSDLVRVIDRAYTITLDNLTVVDAQKGKHDRDPLLVAIMIALVCFGAASWLAYLQIEKNITKNTSAKETESDGKSDLSLPTLDEYTASPGFIRTYNYGRLVMQANHTVKDEDLKALSTERDLNELKLLAPKLNGSGFRYLVSTKLARLIIRDGQLSDGCLKELAHLEQLRHIELSSCRGITASGIQHLKAIPLQNLSLPACGLNGESLRSIAQMRTLTRLNFSANQAVDCNALSLLIGSTELSTLAFSTQQLDTCCFEKIGGMKKLEMLSLNGSVRISASDVAALNRDSKLSRIAFSGDCVSPESLRLLRSFPHLNRLDLEGASFVDQHMEALVDLSQLTQISLENTNVTEKGLAFVLKMPRLQRINLKHCARIPLSAISEISRQLKTCDIVVL